MLNSIPTNSVKGSGLYDSGAMAGLDLMTSLQLLLVQDYDGQLKHLGKQMKIANKIKKAYRQDIEKLHRFLARPTEDKEGIKDAIKVDRGEKYELQREFQYTENLEWDGKGNAFETHRSTFDFGENGFKQKDGHYYISKASIESKQQTLQSKLDTYNEQSEITSLQLQSLTNQRKIAFETVSNLVKKTGDVLNTMTRNVAG